MGALNLNTYTKMCSIQNCTRILRTCHKPTQNTRISDKKADVPDYFSRTHGREVAIVYSTNKSRSKAIITYLRHAITDL